MLQRAASNAYSWWWASHIRTKQSKWLDNHLQDMEHLVKCMLLLLGEEADSFSKRAEMYYKRRPEVITQVEEVYRMYRGLADRYDIMSGELHKANHTIATAFPDQVQYAMLEEEDDNVPKAFTPVDPRKIHKSTVDGLLKKKKGNVPGAGGDKKEQAPMSKENAREEISRLQKAILVMQTEKEFIKNSYESGIAKYWDLEKEINEMQQKACHFQDKFDVSAVIEDDEARALMTATALKSCEDTIVRLQEQRKTAAKQALDESERVKVLREKLKPIMDEHGKSLPDLVEKNIRKNHVTEMGDVYHVKLGELQMQTLVDKIKENFTSDCNITMDEITEQIDELVNKVVDLELMVSSQTSQIDRMHRENEELENSVKSLEEEKGSSELDEKLKQVEEELVRVQALESSFHKDESTIRSNFTETISRFSNFADMLQSPVCDYQAPGSAAHITGDAAAAAAPQPQQASTGDDAAAAPQPQQASTGDAAAAAPQPQAAAPVYVAKTGAAASTTGASVVDGTKNSDHGHDKISRPGSLARLRHISSDVDDSEEQKEKGEKGCVDSDMKKLQERLMDGLEDKEKVLLSEYTSLLEDYKDTKRKLLDVEKKNQECLNEIRSLRNLIGEKEKEKEKERERGSIRGGHRRTPSLSHQRKQSLSSISKLIRMGSNMQDDPPAADLDDMRLPAIAEVENPSPLEEKFRRDIDTLLEENLEFWMKFSSSMGRVQEFQNKYDDLRRVAADGADGEKKLRALKTELQVWSEQNAMLRGELQCRFASLCDIQEEISTALEMDTEQAEQAEEGAPRFTSYSAGKFQGEVLNMQQENNRVSDELQSGLDHVKTIQFAIEKKLNEGVKLSSSSPAEEGEEEVVGPDGVLARVPTKAKVPLQCFLFPTKPKKPSLFARVTPAVLHKQQLDMKLDMKLDM
uniref:NAB domain-containing protein n=1 Tax=Aegilops tauschii subsp. strangulata TaxID=200361 RepID=A0A453GY42_AEGTS